VPTPYWRSTGNAAFQLAGTDTRRIGAGVLINHQTSPVARINAFSRLNRQDTGGGANLASVGRYAGHRGCWVEGRSNEPSNRTKRLSFVALWARKIAPDVGPGRIANSQPSEQPFEKLPWMSLIGRFCYPRPAVARRLLPHTTALRKVLGRRADTLKSVTVIPQPAPSFRAVQGNGGSPTGRQPCFLNAVNHCLSTFSPHMNFSVHGGEANLGPMCGDTLRHAPNLNNVTNLIAHV